MKYMGKVEAMLSLLVGLPDKDTALGHTIFRSSYDECFEGSIEECVQEVASWVQGVLVGNALNTVADSLV